MPGLLRPGVASGCSAAGPHHRPVEDLAGLREALLLQLASGLVGLDSEPRLIEPERVSPWISPGKFTRAPPEERGIHCTEGLF